MPVEILMPRLFDAMTEGDLVVWLVPVGTQVTPGQVIAEIETDKSTVELHAPEAGTLTEILVGAGAQSVPVGERLALLSRDGEAVDAMPAKSEAGAAQVHQAPKSDERVTPLARRMAAQAGIPLADVRGTGTHGRITRDDIERTLGHAPAPVETLEAPATTSATGATGFVSEALSRTRKTIADRLSESKRTIPHFYLQVDCDMERALSLRADANRLRPEQHLSVNDFVIRALGRALVRVPGANASFQNDEVQRYDSVDLSLAVATERGLMTPVLRDVNALAIAQISAEARRLAEKARAGELSPDEYNGGSFTLSNLGMYDVDALYAIINPPQTAIPGIGRARARAIVRDGELAVGRVATLTLSADHRVIDGALGAQLLGAVKLELEDPLGLLL